MYVVNHVYPHDPTAFTEGIYLRNGILTEGTGGDDSRIQRGLLGEKPKEVVKLPGRFGEGIAELRTGSGSFIYQLTWRNGIGFVYDSVTLKPKYQFPINGEGWGLTTDGDKLIASDGSDTLRIYDAGFSLLGEQKIADNGYLVKGLNALTYTSSGIWANIFPTSQLVLISGQKVVRRLDLAKLAPEKDPDRENVTNGTAIDESGKLYVTGKRWPYIYQISYF